MICANNTDFPEDSSKLCSPADAGEFLKYLFYLLKSKCISSLKCEGRYFTGRLLFLPFWRHLNWTVRLLLSHLCFALTAILRITYLMEQII